MRCLPCRYAAFVLLLLCAYVGRVCGAEEASAVDIMTISRAVMGSAADCMQYYNENKAFPQSLDDSFFYLRKLKFLYSTDQKADACTIELSDYGLQVTISHTEQGFRSVVSFLDKEHKPLKDHIFLLGNFLSHQTRYTFEQQQTQPIFDALSRAFPSLGTLRIQKATFGRNVSDGSI